jgi:DNA repair protein RadC
VSEEKPDYLGHRRRLRERFLDGEGTGMSDYELVELLLCQAQPRGDMKPLAKALIAEFDDLAGVFAAKQEELKRLPGMGDASVVALKVVAACALRMQREALLKRPVIGSWKKLLEYCHSAMAHIKVEQFRLLFLDNRNALIADEEQQTGTINHTPVYPREVVKRALELHASAIIMLHNHPSGDPTPSGDDIRMTQEVQEIAAKLNIAVHDHVIIGKRGHASLRNLGLLKG